MAGWAWSGLMPSGKGLSAIRSQLKPVEPELLPSTGVEESACASGDWRSRYSVVY